MSGFGSSVGNNFGGGGVPYLTGLNPAADGLLADFASIQFTLGVAGDIIDLSTVKITINGSLAFDGSIPGFIAPYLTSTYAYSSPDNGYSFVLTIVSGFATPDVLIVVTAKTVDGSSTSQTYSVVTSHSTPYPTIPFGTPLATIPLSAMSGERITGYFVGAQGLVFFTPNLLTPDTTVQLDVDNILVGSDPV